MKTVSRKTHSPARPQHPRARQKCAFPHQGLVTQPAGPLAPRQAPLVQCKLTINEPGDKYEQEADRVAEEVMRMPAPPLPLAQHRPVDILPRLQRKCAACASGKGLCPKCAEEEQQRLQRKPLAASITPVVQRQSVLPEEEEDELLQTKAVPAQTPQITPQIATGIQALRGGGQPLPPPVRAFFEPRFGHDFSHVRVHTDSRAAQLARSVNARAFTVGQDVVFGAGEYAPGSPEGRKLLAHELTHVVQQAQHQAGIIQRQEREEETEAVEEGVEVLENLLKKAVKSLLNYCNAFPDSVCPNTECPSCFCSPLPLSLLRELLPSWLPLPSDEELLLIIRDVVASYALLGISKAVNPRIEPLWRTYLYGGTSSQLDLSQQFGADFTNSRTTKTMNDKVKEALSTNIMQQGMLHNVTIDIPSSIPRLVREMNTAGDSNEMNFDEIGEIPGNIAGGIGTDQTSCLVGAQPSRINDYRGIEGVARIERNSSRSVEVIPEMYYVVEDTLDLCPGDCGADVEQIATLPFSWLEASGVSGDVPFIVRYPSGLDRFTVNF